MKKLKTLYPDIKPNYTKKLEIGDGHSLYLEESGNPDGIPAVFLHGGPGAGCSDFHRQYFNPELYRIILFDQRGAGRSTPHAGLENNTTQHLVADMERIRKELKIDQWLVFGGSWGSTLGLAYAEAHPDKVLGLVLRGIFLCRPKDVEWFYQYGASELFPDLWQSFLEVIPEAERSDMMKAYYRRLTGDNEIARMNAAKAWSVWEGSTSKLIIDPKLAKEFGDPFRALSMARIECHYFINDSFLEPNQLVRNAHKLKKIPGIIVHGRYDVVCPINQAWDLTRAWPEAKFEIVADAGHSATEVGIVDALVRATDEMAVKLQ